jgi:hypothetical protein
MFCNTFRVQRRFPRDATEPAPDHIHFDTCFEEVYRGRVSEHVRRDSPRRVVRGGLEAPGMPAHEFIDAEACERMPTVRAEHRRMRGIGRAVVREETGQLTRRLVPQWAGAPFIAFAVETYTRWASQVEMLDAQIGHLLHTRSGAIEQEEQDAITQRSLATRRKLREQRGHFIALQIAGLRRCGPFGGNRRDALADIEHLRKSSRQIAEEHVDGRQPLIARVDAVVAVDFEMCEELEHAIEGEIADRESGNRPTDRACQECKEEPRRVAIAANRRHAQPLLGHELVDKKRTQEWTSGAAIMASPPLSRVARKSQSDDSLRRAAPR